MQRTIEIALAVLATLAMPGGLGCVFLADDGTGPAGLSQGSESCGYGEVDFTFESGKILVKGTVTGENESKVVEKMVLDSGAQGLSISETLARSIGIQPTERDQSNATLMETFSAKEGIVKSIALGSQVLGPALVSVLPDDRMPYHAPVNLGEDFLERFAVTIDFRKGKLRLQPDCDAIAHLGNLTDFIRIVEDLPVAFGRPREGVVLKLHVTNLARRPVYNILVQLSDWAEGRPASNYGSVKLKPLDAGETRTVMLTVTSAPPSGSDLVVRVDQASWTAND